MYCGVATRWPNWRAGFRLRQPPFAEDRQTNEASLRFRCRGLHDRRIFHVPAGCFIAAGRAEQRQPPLLEVEERIVTVQTADELPHLSPDPEQHPGGRRGGWMVLRRIPDHGLVPLLQSSSGGRRIAPLRTSVRPEPDISRAVP